MIKMARCALTEPATTGLLFTPFNSSSLGPLLPHTQPTNIHFKAY